MKISGGAIKKYSAVALFPSAGRRLSVCGCRSPTGSREESFAFFARIFSSFAPFIERADFFYVSRSYCVRRTSARFGCARRFLPARGRVFFISSPHFFRRYLEGKGGGMTAYCEESAGGLEIIFSAANFFIAAEGCGIGVALGSIFSLRSIH